METCCTAAQMELIGVSADSIAFAFGIGFGAVVSVWAVGYFVALAIAMIRKG